jgi:hypothetical protein
MEQSGEIAGFLSSLMETFGTPRMGKAFADAIAAEPGVLMVGTDPAEWWDNADDIRRAMQAQGVELQGVALKVSHAEGWVQGAVGWGAAKADVAFPDRPTATMRITATLTRRPSGWKIVQCHASVGAANEEVVGKELTI